MYDAYNMYKNVYDAYNMYKNFFYLNKINILIQNYSINNYITHFHTELFCKYIINHLVKYHFKSTCAVSYLFILFLTCISLELFGSLAHFPFFPPFCLTYTPSLPPSLPPGSNRQKCGKSGVANAWLLGNDVGIPLVPHKRQRRGFTPHTFTTAPLGLTTFAEGSANTGADLTVMAFLPRSLLLLLLAVICIQLSGGKTLITL